MRNEVDSRLTPIVSPQSGLPVGHGSDRARGKAAVADEMRVDHRAEPRFAGHVCGRGVRGREALALEPSDERRAGSSGAIHPANAFGAGNLGLGPAWSVEATSKHASTTASAGKALIIASAEAIEVSSPEDLTGGQSEKALGTR